MTNSCDDDLGYVSNVQAFTFATGKLNAAALLSAAYRRDDIHSHNEGFIGAAYTAAHEAMELLLKLYLRRGPGKVTLADSRGHDLCKLFEAWACSDRQKAELKYQREMLVDLDLNRISLLPATTKLRLRGHGKPSMNDSLTVRDAIEQLDAELPPRNISRLCPNYADLLAGFACPPEVWYPEELLSLTWERFTAASRQGESLGLIEAFLKREGTGAVFEGWRYLSEMGLSNRGMKFDGPPAKMILIAQSLRYLIWGMLDKASTHG